MFFDLSLPEIVALLGLGVVLFGPDKLPHAAATAARFLQQVRAFGESTRQDLRKELGPEFDGLDLQDLNPKTFIRKNLLGETEDLRALGAQINQDLRSSLGSPRGPLSVLEPNALAAPAPATVAAPALLAVGERPVFDEDAT